MMRFPDRTTGIGSKMIFYWTFAKELNNHAVHLLAYRWEFEQEILNKLKEGTNVIIDGYAYSGVASSASKLSSSVEFGEGSQEEG